MSEASLSIGRYSYRQIDSLTSSKLINIHDICIVKSKTQILLWSFIILLILVNACYWILVKETLGIDSIWGIVLGALCVKFLLGSQVKKESVVIMPAFGVQLEIHYRGGRVVRRFIPIGKILKPVLNECVTPVTCYWSLALILREEDELMLVFKELQPPVKMLVPVWKALCASTDRKDDLDSLF